MIKESVLIITICCSICSSQLISQRWRPGNFEPKNGIEMRPLNPSGRYNRFGLGIRDDSVGSILRGNVQPRGHPNVILTTTAVPRFSRLISNQNHRRENGNWKIFSNRRTAVESEDIAENQNLPADDSCLSATGDRKQRCPRKIRKLKDNIHERDGNSSRASNEDLKAKNNVLLSRNAANIDRSYSSNLNDRKIESGEAEKLPTKLESNPCSCYWRPEKCGCDCEGFLNYDDFQEMSRNFFPCHKFTFTMLGGDHYAFPPNFFSKIKSVEEFNLLITNATFEYICDPTPMTSPFKGVTFANSALIKLSNVQVRRGWNWKPFEQLQSSSDAQVNIVLEDCKLRRLTSDFSNLASGHVHTVDISNSNLEMVGSNAFGTFENMTHFRVPSNKIQQLRRTDFPEMLFKLEEMDFRHNDLRYLDDDFFTNMPSLKEILLSGNPINVLPENTFHSIISQANLVGISDIPLTCDCRLQWLKDSMLHDEATKKNMQGAVCKRPSYLRGMPFDYLSREHLLCL